VISLGGLLVVASVVVALSAAGDTVVSDSVESVVSDSVDSRLLELPFSAAGVESWSLGSPETDAKVPSINARQKVFMFR